MYIRVRYRQQGGHYHARVFIGPAPNYTMAQTGTLVCREQEWPDFRDRLSRMANEIRYDRLDGEDEHEP
jgi:hypothetical protein